MLVFDRSTRGFGQAKDSACGMHARARSVAARAIQAGARRQRHAAPCTKAQLWCNRFSRSDRYELGNSRLKSRIPWRRGAHFGHRVRLAAGCAGGSDLGHTGRLPINETASRIVFITSRRGGQGEEDRVPKLDTPRTEQILPDAFAALGRPRQRSLL